MGLFQKTKKWASRQSLAGISEIKRRLSIGTGLPTVILEAVKGARPGQDLAGTLHAGIIDLWLSC